MAKNKDNGHASVRASGMFSRDGIWWNVDITEDATATDGQRSTVKVSFSGTSPTAADAASAAAEVQRRYASSLKCENPTTSPEVAPADSTPAARIVKRALANRAERDAKLASSRAK